MNFGEELYRKFFKSYTEKVWGVDCKNISKVRTGTKASANTKKKMSDSQMNHEVSDETKQKLSIAHKGISIESKYGKEKATPQNNPAIQHVGVFTCFSS